MAGVTTNELSFTNVRGQRLFGIEVLPADEAAAKCAVIWAHGHGEHCRRKLRVFQSWAEQGIAVFAFDAHGFGASEPTDPKERALVLTMAHLVDDMADYAVFAENRHPRLEPLPWFAGGNGTGALVATLTVLRWQEQWAGLLLFAPAVEWRLPPGRRFQQFLAPCFDCWVPRTKISQGILSSPAELNPDPEAIAAYEADPLCTRGPMRVRTAFQYRRTVDVLQASAGKISLPIYCEHCKGDAVADWEASREFCACVAAEDVHWLAPEGGCHDELSGKRALEPAGRMAAWMLAKAGEAKPRDRKSVV